MNLHKISKKSIFKLTGLITVLFILVLIQSLKAINIHSFSENENQLLINQNDSVLINIPIQSILVKLNDSIMPLNFNLSTINSELIDTGYYIKPYPIEVQTKLIKEYGPEAENGVFIIKTKEFKNPTFTTLSNGRFVFNSDTVYNVVDKIPEFPGGNKELIKFLHENIQYPELARLIKMEGKVIAELEIDISGKVNNVRLVKVSNKIFNNEVIRVINKMPRWISGEKEGKKVNCLISLNFNFRRSILNDGATNISFNEQDIESEKQFKMPLIVLDNIYYKNNFDLSLINPKALEYQTFHSGELNGTINYFGKDGENGVLSLKSRFNNLVSTVIPYDSIDHKNNLVFDAVEQMPQFPGGEDALIKYLCTKVVYPKEAMEQNIQGRVICGFVVKSDGKISDVIVLRSANPILDAEAIKVVLSMPKWIPGKQQGKPVSVRFCLPITFKF